MSAIDTLLQQPPYSLPAEPRLEMFRAALRESIQHHCASCAPFARWYGKHADPDAPIGELADVPYLPVGIFKRLNLQSVGQGNVVRVLRSSATSSQTPSSVALDAITRDRQMRVLAQLMKEAIGPVRRPFLVLDAAPSAGVEVELAARVAGLRGYLMMASEIHYVMDTAGGTPVLNVEKLQTLLAGFAAAGKPVCLLGYTYMLYQHGVAPLLKQRVRCELPAGSYVLHFGGWKRLQNQAVGREEFNDGVSRVFAMDELRVRDIYGFTEQLGIIYPDDGHGVRTTPAYAEVLVRDPFTLRTVPDGEPGLLQFLTPLPHSYPGVSVLLDDMGRIVSRAGGTSFEVLGRARGSEIRGCGDTLPERVYEVQA